MEYNVNQDAWSSGQIGSKIWMRERLIEIMRGNEYEWWNLQKIAILGGWYGMSAFLLLSDPVMPVFIDHIRSYDIDPTCEPIADMINENWVFDSWKFKAMTGDVDEIDFSDFDIIINTSTEHMSSNKWFDNLNNEQLIVIQSNNMPHDDHIHTLNTLEEFEKEFPLNSLYSGQLDFHYETWEFSRWMNIGTKYDSTV